ncbi:MAG: C40 family peptidase [Polyangia bacterium]
MLAALLAGLALCASAGSGCSSGSASSAAEPAGAAPTTGPSRACDRSAELLRPARQALLSTGRAVVVTALADLLEKPDAAGALADQARLGDVVTVLPPAPEGGGACRLPRDAFVEVETAERYRGFVAVTALRPWTEAAPYRSGPRERVVARLANVYPQPDLTKSNPMLVLPLGVELRRGRDLGPRWLEALLPDGRTGYIQRGDVGPAVQPGQAPLTAACLVEHSLLHDGTPYLWGGRSTLGIDCSGLVANAFAACGVLAPRDAGPQHDWSETQPVPKDVSALRPGDLLFFGSDSLVGSASLAAPAPGGGTAPPSPRITHVGIYVSEGRFVHASTSERPAVHISDLRAPEWQRRWLSVRRHEKLAAASAEPSAAATASASPGPAPAAAPASANGANDTIRPQK